ncbi:MAG TPA: hypothetical protein VFT75_15145 [Nocardioidaceae bacterium]|nr:hypothetical protein [Nocardioidaceae bacterium]
MPDLGRESVLFDLLEAPCAEWCASHHDPGTGLDDGLCRSRTIAVGEHALQLQRDPDTADAVVRIGTGPGDWIELDDAPWLTSLLSSLLDAATTAAPAESESMGVVAGYIGTSRQELADTLGVDLENASRLQAQRMAGALALHGVTIS